MSASEPTPGPWRVQIGSTQHRITGVEVDDTVALVSAAFPANAHLISAAPELLDRVRQRYSACDCLDAEDQGSMGGEQFFDEYACADCHADRAALAKARGAS